MRERLAHIDSEILVLDPPSYDQALIGYSSAPTGEAVAVYSANKLLDILAEDMKNLEDPREAAQEWFDFNIAGAYVGPRTPVLVWDLPEEAL